MMQIEGHYLEWDGDEDCYVCVGCENCKPGEKFVLKAEPIRKMQSEDIHLISESEIEEIVNSATNDETEVVIDLRKE